MTWMLVLVCLLLMILWLNFRLNGVEKANKGMNYSFQSLLDKIVKLRKRVEYIELRLNIEHPDQKEWDKAKQFESNNDRIAPAASSTISYPRD